MSIDYFEVDNVFIDKEILTNKFTCNLEICKGACCFIESEYGAPILKEEIKKVENILNIIKKYLPEKNIDEIQQKGFWERKEDELLIKSINNRECVFVYYDNDIAKCGIEKAFYNGEIDFIKPISCHLFPIRVSDFGGPILKLAKYPDCESAFDFGEKNDTKVYKFCKAGLTRSFGKNWFNKLETLTNIE